MSTAPSHAAIQRDLAAAYNRAHSLMRNIDGLQPQEAFDELLKYLFLKQVSEDRQETLPAAPKDMRARFAEYLSRHNSWSAGLWQDRAFLLSDGCLQQCNAVLGRLNFSAIDCDIRSAALREFLTADVRKGLGIYLTPDDLVREIIRFVSPAPGSRCLDPACGSGTFLIELLKHWQAMGSRQCEVWGADKNPRMLLISELNLGHFAGATFTRRLMDSLAEPAATHACKWLRPGTFDFVFTNPPFGVTLDADRPEFADYAVARAGSTSARAPSEWFFVEQSLRWLKPGGTLAIVLPRSVLTNPSQQPERKAIGGLGRLRAVIALPPETFHSTGTRANVVAAVIDRHGTGHGLDTGHMVTLASISNVGFDSTGRHRAGSQLAGLAQEMRAPPPASKTVRVISDIAAGETWEILVSAAKRGRARPDGVPLGDLAECLATGKTPPRSGYADKDGLFLVKVGNLSGSGIRWIARERNFAPPGGRFKPAPLLKRGDILLTSCAHSPVYIAKKVDIVTQIPGWVGGAASFVGEVMLVRPAKSRIAPFALLGFLRQPATAAGIRDLVRGQTAHLYPDDLAELRIPHSVLDMAAPWPAACALLEEEAALNDKLNEIVRRQQELSAALES